MARAKKNKLSDVDAEMGDADLVIEAEHVDELPDDLDAEGYVGVYQFPDNKRRRTPALLYLVVGLVMLLSWLVTRTNGSSLVNRGFGVGGAFL